MPRKIEGTGWSQNVYGSPSILKFRSVICTRYAGGLEVAGRAGRKNPKMIAAAGKNYKMDAGASARIRKTTEATSKTIADWKGAHPK